MFHPELFECRAAALNALAEAGYAWLSDFSSIDLLHDVYGLEVCGIADRGDADRMLWLLRRLFPSWRYSYVSLKDWGDRDLGWMVVVHRDREPSGSGEASTV